MQTLSTTFRLCPPVGACLRWALTLAFWLLIAVLGMLVTRGLWSHQTWPADFTQRLLSMIGVFAGVGVLMG